MKEFVLTEQSFREPAMAQPIGSGCPLTVGYEMLEKRIKEVLFHYIKTSIGSCMRLDH